MMETLTVPRCPDVVLSDFGSFFEEQRRRREASPVAEAQPEAALSDEDARRVALLHDISAEVLNAASAQLAPHGVLVERGPSLRGRPDFEQAYTQFMLINRQTGRASDVYVMSITDAGYFLASACDPRLDHDHLDRQVTHCAASALTCDVVARVMKDAILHVA
ncbi:hypothetical protein NS228_24315 [Methylobacterium indicum]|uniref:Uncharacterized protein n=1 Tax=Methylobacterium indicum TaxID=1775910 RepID=A0A8H8WU50_9HYPH|nr:hypothetical protein [Methylobacterium indicum]KTS14885.1 hypothetical protein NS229_27840 [Methylobacterium indicum]KTS30429.1 hypothetical protein NS228_24315 [Methylobacterium indicum]KTS53911.1 hypothetical protein NS230_03600 [Methylobacterium indicum]BCM84461.1 hypothetical protein mvi_29220 [Methylobacterium indicum]